MDNKKEFPDWDSFYKENKVENMPWYEKNLDPDLEYQINSMNITKDKFLDLDSEPVTFKDFVNFIVEYLDVKHPGNVPVFLAKAALGGDLIKLLTTSMHVSNKKISKIYSFKYPIYKEGIPKVISELQEKYPLLKK